MKAINVNDTECNYTDLILSGIKTIETRETRSLKSLVGKRVGLISTHKNRKAFLVGYVDIVSEIKYNTVEEFRKDCIKHHVLAGSKYDIKMGGVKYGYVLANPQECDPVLVTAKGIVIRNI